ncbi:hypothetical protein QUF50_00375 [Thiotrichales bacterium HSG1]|nr:hypothetical protein [Thiotrichales bacterium HSG1]
MNRQPKRTSVGQNSANFKKGQVGCKKPAWWHGVLVVGLMANNYVFSETCVIDESTLSTSSEIHYALNPNHPSGSISSTSNSITLRAFTLDDGYKLLKECVIGNFTNQSDKYEMYYSSENKPLNGHDRYAFYANTLYESFPEYRMYASDGKSLLYKSVDVDVNLGKCWKNASNYAGGNLNRNNNFWTYFCPKQGLLDYIDRTIIEKTPTCQLYGVHDEGLNNTQFLTITPETFEVKALGEMKKAHDIEALDIHPQTTELFAASGKDTKKQGYLYNVDKTTGQLTEIGSTGFKEIDGLSFHPDGILWGWATGDGLVTIDTTTGKANLVATYSGEVEDLTWNTAGTMLFGVENVRNNPDAGVKLLAYDGNTVTTVCEELTQSLEIEALDTLPDDTLIFGLHGKNGLPLGVIDVNTCQITAETEIATGYDDVEGIAWPTKACSLVDDVEGGSCSTVKQKPMTLKYTEQFDNFTPNGGDWSSAGSPIPQKLSISEAEDGYVWDSNGDANYHSGSYLNKFRLPWDKEFKVEFRLKQPLSSQNYWLTNMLSIKTTPFLGSRNTGRAEAFILIYGSRNHDFTNRPYEVSADISGDAKSRRIESNYNDGDWHTYTIHHKIASTCEREIDISIDGNSFHKESNVDYVKDEDFYVVIEGRSYRYDNYLDYVKIYTAE